MKTKPLVLLNITLAICLVTALLLSSGMITVGNTDYSVKKEEWDPWCDLNEDGIVDMKDIYEVVRHYTTSGEPTKNVNVTNWLLEFPVRVTNFPLDEQGNIRANVTNWQECSSLTRSWLNESLGSASIPPRVEWDAPVVIIGGYKHYYVYVQTSREFTLNFYFRTGGLEIFSHQMQESQAKNEICGPYDVKGSELALKVHNPSYSENLTVSLAVYAPPV